MPSNAFTKPGIYRVNYETTQNSDLRSITIPVSAEEIANKPSTQIVKKFVPDLDIVNEIQFLYELPSGTVSPPTSNPNLKPPTNRQVEIVDYQDVETINSLISNDYTIREFFKDVCILEKVSTL